MVKNSILFKSKYKKARALMQENSCSEAREILLGLCRKFKMNIDPWLDLIVLERQSGNYSTAMDICRQAVLIYPKSVKVFHLLGSVQHCVNDFNSAICSYKKSIELDSSFPETHYFLGNTYRTIGQYADAEISYKNAVTLSPNYLEALSNLGAVLINLKKLDEADVVLQKAYKLMPDSEIILCNVAELYLVMNKNDEALIFVNKALLRKSNFHDAHLIKGKILRLIGKYDDALESYKRALAIDPEDDASLAAMAEIHEKRGDVQKSYELLNPVIEQGNRSPILLVAYSKVADLHDEKNIAVKYLETALENKWIDVSVKIGIHSELGRFYEKEGEFDKSFKNFQQANIAERETNPFFLEHSRDQFNDEFIESLESIYTNEIWKNIPILNDGSIRPIFIVGMPRSGTTLIEQILASHTDVYGAGELAKISEIAREIDYMGFVSGNIESFIDIDLMALNKTAEKYLGYIKSLDSNSKYVTDKMPTNYWYIGLISRLFPQAKIIHAVRNSLDTCLSIYFERFSSEMTFTTDLEELANYYLRYNKIMAYWRESLSVTIYDVIYEDLVANQQKVTRDLLAFCDLDWDDKCLSFYKNKRDVNTPSYNQVRKPIYTKSIGRWKRYEKNIAVLINKLADIQA